jgi:hypothetical protein
MVGGGFAMLAINELSERIDAYASGRISLGELEEWFEENSCGADYDDAGLRAACAAVDAALAGYHFDHVGEDELKRDNGRALRPPVADSPFSGIRVDVIHGRSDSAMGAAVGAFVSDGRAIDGYSVAASNANNSTPSPIWAQIPDIPLPYVTSSGNVNLPWGHGPIEA